MTVAVTLFALLELYKRGEAAWEQAEPFGPITVRAAGAARGGPAGGEGGRHDALERDLEALLFLAPDPVAGRRARRRRCGSRRTRSRAGLRALRRGAARAAAIVLRELAGGWTLASHPDAEEAARRLLARPRTPGLTPAQAETLVDRRLPAAGLAARGRAHPRRRVGVGRPPRWLDRGLIEEAGRSQFGAVLYRTTPLFLKLFGLRSVDELPDLPRSGTRARRSRPRCATGCCARARSAPATAAPEPVSRAPARRGELAAGRVDVAAAGEADRRAQAVLLERRLEARSRRARGALVGRARRVVRDQVDLVDRAGRAAAASATAWA